MSSTASKADCGSDANGAARRTSASSSSVAHSSTATMATTCWASTSSGLRGMRSDSIAPLRIRSATTAACTRSPRNLGKTTPWLTAPTWCPARPTRCSPEATEGGDSTCTTRSTAPMSMPSSRLLVATTAGSRPLLRSSSMTARCSLLTEPWWARASTGAAPPLDPACAMSAAGAPPVSSTSPVTRSCQISLSRAVSRSARRRELAKTSVLRWLATRSTTRSSTCGQIDGVTTRSVASSCTGTPSALMSSTGTTTSSSMRLLDSGATTTTSRLPPRKRATSSTGRTVAESPMRRAGAGSRASSRSRESARCAPRLVPATACTSSTITVSMPRRLSRACEVRMRKSDSGVVMSTSGGRRDCRARSAGGVSPVRIATSTAGSGSPRRTASRLMPTRGERRLRSTSTASALSGET